MVMAAALLVCSQGAWTVASVTTRFMFPDTCDMVVAAESVFRTWVDSISIISRMGITQGTARKFATKESSLAALAEERMWDLHALVENDQVPPGALQAKASGQRLSAILRMDPSPQWLVDMLRRHHDVRVRDLAGHTEEGRVVTTNKVMDATVMVLHERRKVPLEEARLLVKAFVRKVSIVEVDRSLPEAVASGDLADLLDRVRRHAPQHLADIDPSSPTWSARTKPSKEGPPAGTSYRQFKEDNPQVFGVDGEDLEVLAQVLRCQEELMKDFPDAEVFLSTSDAHAAHAASLSGVCSAKLYSWGDKGDVVAEDLQRERSHRVTMAPPRAEARAEAGARALAATAGAP